MALAQAALMDGRVDSLTPAQAKILDCWVVLTDFHGVPPTMREVAELYGCSFSAVRHHAQEMIRRGALRRVTVSAARSLVVTGAGRAWWASRGDVVRPSPVTGGP